MTICKSGGQVKSQTAQRAPSAQLLIVCRPISAKLGVMSKETVGICQNESTALHCLTSSPTCNALAGPCSNCSTLGCQVVKNGQHTGRVVVPTTAEVAAMLQGLLHCLQARWGPLAERRPGEKTVLHSSSSKITPICGKRENRERMRKREVGEGMCMWRHAYLYHKPVITCDCLCILTRL